MSPQKQYHKTEDLIEKAEIKTTKKTGYTFSGVTRYYRGKLY